MFKIIKILSKLLFLLQRYTTTALHCSILCSAISLSAHRLSTYWFRKKLITIIILSFCLSSCFNTNENFAPVTEISTIETLPKSGFHRVLPEETLYSIAWRYGLDYKDLAKRNKIKAPYHIHTGQILYLTQKAATIPSPFSAPKDNVNKQLNINKNITEREPTGDVQRWQWPAAGPIVGNFAGLNKGINIRGQLADPIYATAPGKVVYSGNGLRGYGNLIILKHNSQFLSAYAHNNRNFVADGEWVKSGQKIAEMGNSGSRQIMLHFEIRKNGHPVNPLIYLKSKG